MYTYYIHMSVYNYSFSLRHRGELYVLARHRKMCNLANWSRLSNITFWSRAPGRATEEQTKQLNLNMWGESST
jgi:hypothetical protein